MKVLTVRQPWAWAIIHGGKDVENRTRNVAGAYRGPVAIHVALTDDVTALDYGNPFAGLVNPPCPRHRDVTHNRFTCLLCTVDRLESRWGNQGHIIGVVDLVDVHHCFNALTDFEGCSPWAEVGSWHLRLENPRPVEPFRWKGALGLRELPGDVAALVIERTS